jgi:SAM-dependent methyltransferase
MTQIHTLDPDRKVGAETGKSWRQKIESGFWQRYLGDGPVCEIGFRGHEPGHLPLTENTIGVDLDYLGYNGLRLPFGDGHFSALYSSHCLEHITQSRTVIQDYHRVVRTGGHIILVVPHAYLYERTLRIPPSRWNGDHKRPYTPAILLMDIEDALLPNTYRVRHCCDNDAGYDYSRGPDEHAHGCYEIELVIQKIVPPAWRVEETG